MNPKTIHKMKRLLTVCTLAAALLLPAAAAPKETKEKPAAEKAPAAPTDFTGRYERSGDGKTVFILHVRQSGFKAELEFSASRADGSGAAPDGHGTASLDEKGGLAGTFEDSFGNKGTVTMTKVRGSYQLTLKPETVADPRAVKFYGPIALKRTVDREN